MAEKETFEALPAGSSLEELIEAERVNLMQVQGMARVLYDVLLYSDDDDGTMHADVAKVIARLIEESVSSRASRPASSARRQTRRRTTLAPEVRSRAG